MSGSFLAPKRRMTTRRMRTIYSGPRFGMILVYLLTEAAWG
jgi:hypothetical protein